MDKEGKKKKNSQTGSQTAAVARQVGGLRLIVEAIQNHLLLLKLDGIKHEQKFKSQMFPIFWNHHKNKIRNKKIKNTKLLQDYQKDILKSRKLLKKSFNWSAGKY